MSEVLEVRKLTVTIDSAVALRDVTFVLEAGDALLVLGPNGAGKTVLLRALLGLVPVEGQVRWSVPAPPPGYLPQRLDMERHLPMCGEDLGALLASALIMIPPALARRLTHRLALFMGISAAASACSMIGGIALAAWRGLPLGPAVVAVASLLFMGSLPIAER
jgi:energy-coupling factor transporter ATP-binding protein EcfA2